MAISHADCTHPRTPAGRRACRAGNAPLVVTTPDPISVYARTHHLSADAENGMRVAMAQVTTAPIEIEIARSKMNQTARRRMAAAPRIQPRKSGARVSVTSSTCVQAALHSSRGLCACGHMTGEFRIPA